MYMLSDSCVLGYLFPPPCVNVSLFLIVYQFSFLFVFSSSLLLSFSLANSLACWLAHALPSYSLWLALHGQITVAFVVSVLLVCDHRARRSRKHRDGH